MIIDKIYTDLSGCKGCSQCEYYPYFHYAPTKDSGERIVFTKHDINHCEVVNITTGVKHIYNGLNWSKVES